jgi:hypothetical protein
MWYNKNMKRKTIEEFIEDAKKIHKNLVTNHPLAIIKTQKE